MPPRKELTILRIKTRTTKMCSLCNVEKLLNEFHKDRKNIDGHYSNCKECRIKKSHNDYLKRRNKIKKYVKGYRGTHAGKEARKREHERFKKLKPAIYRVGYMVSNAIRDKRLIRKPCEKCGGRKAQAHHPDYNKPFDVMWLCKPHHDEWHRNNTPIYPKQSLKHATK